MSVKNLINIYPLIVLLILSSCGGGSSNSGPVAPPRVFATAGVYDAEITVEYSINGESLGEPSMGDLRITVAGQEANQQAIIAFREFSGSSSISPSLEFSIPGGNFNITSDTDVDCIGQLVFTGRFSGTSVSGDVTGDFDCGAIGNITATGTFSGALGSAKALLNDEGPNFPFF